MNSSTPTPLTTRDLQVFRDIASKLAREAGQLAVDMRHDAIRTTETKSSATDLVTAADEAAERHIVEGLARTRPDDGIEGEEGSNRSGTSGIVWHIDPIDGTTNYVYGLPYCVSIGATFQAEPSHQDPNQRRIIAGAVFNPTTDELFHAAIGQGAQRNDTSITTTTTAHLATALLGTGFGYDVACRQRQATNLASIIGSVRDIRRIGAAALDLCAVACGQLDAYFEEGLNFWDMAAGIIIAREAGATVTDVEGSEPSTDSLVAANPFIHTDLVETIRSATQTG